MAAAAAGRRLADADADVDAGDAAPAAATVLDFCDAELLDVATDCLAIADRVRRGLDAADAAAAPAAAAEE